MEANPRIGLIYSDALFFSDQRGLFPGSYNTEFPTPNLQVLWTLFRYNYIPVLTVVLRRDCLDQVGLFDETVRICGDYDLWLRVIEKFPIYFLNQPLTRYRQSPNSICQDKEQMFVDYLRTKEKVIGRNPEFLNFPMNFLDPYFYDIYLGLANLHIQNHQIEQARRVLHCYREMRGETARYEEFAIIYIY